MIADLDGTGRDDVAVALEDRNAVAIHLASGGWPNFQPAVLVPVSPGPIDVQPFDVDGDGDLDLAVICEFTQVVQVLQNNGGTFATSTAVPLLPAVPRALASGDLNGDGLTDLAIGASQGVFGVMLALVNTTTSPSGTPSFGAPTITPVGQDPDGIDIGDLDGDGYQDVAVLSGGADAVEVLRNDPLGLGGTSLSFTITVFPLAPASILIPEFSELGIADFDGDGDRDVVASCDGNDVVAALSNDGFGTFAGPDFFASPRFPGDLVVADFDGDDSPDVATANFVSSSIGVLLDDLGAGRCDHRLVGGIPDDFDPAIPTGSEDACPGPLLAGWAGAGAVRDFDESGADRTLLHTFDRLPDRIVAAALVLQLRADAAGAVDDRIALGLDGANGRLLWSRPIGELVGASWTPPTIDFVTLDLADLPGRQSLLPKIAAQDRLDLVVSDDTAVDFAELSLKTAAASDTPLVHRAGAYRLGSTFQWSVAGTPIGAGAGTAILAGRGLGSGPVIPGGALCITGPTVLGVVANSPTGSTRFSRKVPAIGLPPCTTLATQAISWGPGFRPVFHSNTLTQTFFD